MSKIFRGHGLVVEHVLAKDETRVRFSLAAYNQASMERDPTHESKNDVSRLLLQRGKFGHSMLYDAISSPSSEVTLPEGDLVIDLDLTNIEDTKLLEMITGDVKFILEDSEKAKRLTSVRLKIKRSQMNRQITNYRMAFPSKYEVVEGK